MKIIPIFLLMLFLTACSAANPRMESPPAAPPVDASPTVEQPVEAPVNTPEQAAEPTQNPRADLPDFGPAPELTNQVWLNVDRPLRLAQLRGKVVLLEMWTFG